MPDEASADLVARYRAGDQTAADELFHRYVTRLTALAQTRLTPRLASRTDPEDIVLSAYRSFFVGVRSGRFTLSRSGDLWRLLISITMHKLYHQVRFHHAQSRNVTTDCALTDEVSLAIRERREPSPDEALTLSDELHKCLAMLDPFARRVLELRLQDSSLAAIAADTGRSERTVRRTLAAIELRLRDQLRDTRDG